MLISCVRSRQRFVANDVAHHLGFIGQRKRTNVALSRAKSLCVVCGNPAVLLADATWQQYLAYVEHEGLLMGVPFVNPIVHLPQTKKRAKESTAAVGSGNYDNGAEEEEGDDDEEDEEDEEEEEEEKKVEVEEKNAALGVPKQLDFNFENVFDNTYSLFGNVTNRLNNNQHQHSSKNKKNKKNKAHKHHKNSSANDEETNLNNSLEVISKYLARLFIQDNIE